MKTVNNTVQFIYSPSSNRIYNETGIKEDVREPVCEFWSKSTAEDYAALICKAVNNFYPMMDMLKEFCELRTAYSSDEFNEAYHKAKEIIKAAEQA